MQKAVDTKISRSPYTTHFNPNIPIAILLPNVSLTPLQSCLPDTCTIETLSSKGTSAAKTHQSEDGLYAFLFFAGYPLTLPRPYVFPPNTNTRHLLLHGSRLETPIPSCSSQVTANVRAYMPSTTKWRALVLPPPSPTRPEANRLEYASLTSSHTTR